MICRRPWVIGSPSHRPLYRMLHVGCVMWTGNPDMALQFHRKEDAEAYQLTDEDAYSVMQLPRRRLSKWWLLAPTVIVLLLLADWVARVTAP